MSTPLIIQGTTVANIPQLFRAYSEVQPFTYRSGSTYTQILESMRVWILDDLVPYLNTNFSDIQDNWDENIQEIVDAINTAMQNALDAIANADLVITDPAIVAVLNAATSQTKTALDARYGAASIAPVAAKNGLTGKYHIDGYGASPGASPSSNRQSIQAAINAAGADYDATGVRQTVLVPNATFPVDLIPWYAANGTTQAGVASIVCHDGVDIEFQGIVKLKDNAYTAGDLATGYGAIFRNNASGVGYLSHASFRGVGGGGIDGNSAAQPSGITDGSGNLKGVSLINAASGQHVTVHDLLLINSTLSGARLTGGTTRTCTNIRMRNNRVRNIAGIGLQCSNFDGLQIVDNFVDTTGDNGIDIYGENGTAVVNGTNFVVDRNIVRSSATGVFLETVAFGSAADNIIISCGTGIRLNRINGEPQDVNIHDNTIQGGVTAIYMTGTMRSCRVHHNNARLFTGQGMLFGSGSGSTTSNIDVDNNTLDGVDATVPLYKFGGTTVANITIARPKSYTITDPTSPNFYVTGTSGTGATTALSNVVKASVNPALESDKGGATNVASGTVFTLAGFIQGKSGILTIEANSGGAWYSTWVGVINGGSGRVDVAQIATNGATPGNAILSVTGSTTNNTVTVTLRATGSNMNYSYRIDWSS